MFRRQTLLRPDPARRLLVVGLGKPEELDPERIRIAAAIAVQQAASFEATAHYLKYLSLMVGIR